MDIVTKNLDHLGLVAGMCDEIGIVDLIDRACGPQDPNKHLTYGQCVKCMLLNGLGFVGRTLYLYSEYFEDKPIEHLVGANVKPEQVDDNVLGRALDKLFELGVTGLYTKIALKAVRALEIDVKSLHLDSTSFHVDGEYNSLLDQGESCIKITKGYSRDHRPELNQVVLNVMTSNQGGLPLFMQAASGNSSDKTAFTEIISKHIESFQAAVNNRYTVGDSALYTPASIQKLDESNALFVSRVPNQINKEKALVEKIVREEMEDLGNGYKGKEFRVSYADVEQRWSVIFSEAAYKRECQTLLKNFMKGSEKELKAFKKFSKQIFSCEKDAKKAVEKLISKYKYLSIRDIKTVEVNKRPSAGRPKKGTVPMLLGYRIKGTALTHLETKAKLEKKKGFFTLATNDLDKANFPMSNILSTYKSQQSVERGFRFLKSPDFLVSSFFLKKPERIEALLMVMTLCLLIYASIEHQVRRKLKEDDQYFLNQKRKPAQNPTSRWIFFCFLGLHMVYLSGKKHQISNLKERHDIILSCLGTRFRKLYYSETW
jgi:transposase